MRESKLLELRIGAANVSRPQLGTSVSAKTVTLLGVDWRIDTGLYIGSNEAPCHFQTTAEYRTAFASIFGLFKTAAEGRCVCSN